MKHLVLAIAFVTMSCKSEPKPPPPPPEPVAPAPPTPAPPAPPSGSAAGLMAPPPADCHLHIAITADKIAWDGALTGSTPWKSGDKPNLTALEARRGCHAQIVSASAVKYEDVVAVMDNLIKLGITNIDLGSGSDSTPPADSMHGSAETHIGSDGRLSITVTLPDPKAALANAPIIIVTKTEVRLGDKVIGKPGDADLQAKVTAALPPKPSDPTAILQADKDTPSATVMHIVEAAGASGYTNLLFAVKTK